MIDRVIGWFAPHICEGCGVAGSTLCECCNNNIMAHPWLHCVQCLGLIDRISRQNQGNLCHTCRRHTPFDKAFVVGERADTLERLVGNFKYLSRRDSATAMASLLSSVMPDSIPDDIQIVFVPSSPKNIRERGFDHMKLVASQLAKQRQLAISPVIERLSNQAQHSASRAKRLKQARLTFGLNNTSVPEQVLLIDDIYTTGATVQTIAELLRQAGTKTIWLAIVARQRH